MGQFSERGEEAAEPVPGAAAAGSPKPGLPLPSPTGAAAAASPGTPAADGAGVPADHKHDVSVGGSSEAGSGSADETAGGAAPVPPWQQAHYDAQRDVVLRLEFLRTAEVKARAAGAARGATAGKREDCSPAAHGVEAGPEPLPRLPALAAERPPCQPTLPAAPPQAIIRAVRLAVAVGVAMLAVLLALKVQKARCRGVVVRWAPLSTRWGGTMQAEWPGRSSPRRRMPRAAHGLPSPSAHARPVPL